MTATVRKLLEMDIVCVCPIITAEILQGAISDREFNKLTAAFEALVQLPIEERDWIEAASLGYHLRKKGFTIPLTDLLIATVAIRTKCFLLHADKHFDVIGRFSDLKIIMT
jgi:predicted nucleic acid-binding protein